jgi:nicotinamidase/pyrazinamidase
MAIANLPPALADGSRPRYLWTQYPVRACPSVVDPSASGRNGLCRERFARREVPPDDTVPAASYLLQAHYFTLWRMPGLVFWDVDTQQDFMHADGKLHVPGSEAIIPALERLTSFAHQRGIRILASAEDHVPGHRELSDHPDFRETFPPHCMRGTSGQLKIPETALRDPLVIEPDQKDVASRLRAHQGDILFHKHSFDVFSNPNVVPVLRALDPSVVVLYGVPLDICDRYAIQGLLRHRPHTRLYFVVDAAKAIRHQVAEHLLKEWAEEGVRLVRSTEIVEDGILDGYLNG